MSGFIRLLDSNKELVIDSVSVEYEDSFCLESFGDLAKAYFDFSDNKGSRGFIIARVQSWDHKQPGKAFYSYYHAFHLNKILFQTQVYLGKKLIHRLHVLNPLTNTDIIGNVQYFLIQKKGAHLRAEDLKCEKIVERSADDTATIIGVADESTTAQKTLDSRSPEVAPTSKAKVKLLKINTGTSSIKAKGSTVKNRGGLASATVREVETGIPQTWTMTSSAVAVVEDNETGDSHPSGIYNPKFKVMSARTPRLSTALKRPESEPQTEAVNVPYTPLTAPPIMIPEPHIPISPFPTPDITMKAASALTPYLQDIELINLNLHRRHTAVTITTKKASKPLYIRRNGPAQKIDVTRGSVTRFSVEIPAAELESIGSSKYSRRRSLSYANAVIAAGTRATFKEWLDMVKQEKAERATSPNDDNDAVKLKFGTPTSAVGPRIPSPIKTKAGKTGRVPVIQEFDDDFVNLPEAEINTAHIVDFEWDGVLFATDTDFLESSKIRMKFKENAIIPEDAMLFKMKSYTGDEAASIEVVIDDQLVFFDCCYPTEEQLTSSSRTLRFFHRYKCYILALILITGVFIFIYLTLTIQR